MPRSVKKSKSKRKILKSTRRKSRKRKTSNRRSQYDGAEPEEYLWVFKYSDPAYKSGEDWDRTRPEFNPDMYTLLGVSYLIVVKSHYKPIDIIYNYLIRKEYINGSTLSEEKIKSIIDRNTKRKDDSLYAQIINYDDFDSQDTLES